MVHTHRVAKGIRHSRDKGLQSQMIRAAQSIPTNIVQGRRQKTDKKFGRFLWIALNSATELEYHVTAARDIEVISDADSDTPSGRDSRGKDDALWPASDSRRGGRAVIAFHPIRAGR